MNATAPNPSAAFKPGDKVMLRSGGPTLTVVDLGVTSGLVWCRWMVDGMTKEESFSPVMLANDPRPMRA